MLVENFIVHDVPGKENTRNTVKLKSALKGIKISGPCVRMNLPESINHELLLLFAHPNGQQRPDLPQGGQEVDGVLHGGGADGVGLPHGPQQLPDAVVLPPQQAEHLADQLWVLDVTLLSPADHGLGDQLFEVGCKEKEISIKSIFQPVLCL